jgi:hypothetical protein
MTIIRIYLVPKMRYFYVSEEMSTLYFGLAVFCLFEARVLELYRQPLLPTAVKVYTLTSNWQITQSPKYNDDIYLLI